MCAIEEKSFPARLALLPEAVAFAHAFCERWGIARVDSIHLALIVEELFTNTVEHGHGGDSDAPIAIALSLASDGVCVRFEDSAPPFDPRARLSTQPTGITRPLEARPIGGLGIYLVGQWVEASSYVYEDGRNRLRLKLRFNGLP